MNIIEARRLLDAVRNAGTDYPEHQISLALVLTGDLAADVPIVTRRAAGTWERETSAHMAKAHVWDGLAV